MTAITFSFIFASALLNWDDSFCFNSLSQQNVTQRKENKIRPAVVVEEETNGVAPSTDAAPGADAKPLPPKADPYKFLPDEPVDLPKVLEKFQNIIALRGKGKSLKELVSLLQGLREAANGKALGVPIDIKLLMGIISCHFDEKMAASTNLTSSTLLTFMPHPVWLGYVSLNSTRYCSVLVQTIGRQMPVYSLLSSTI
jgi:hypothetical protein